MRRRGEALPQVPKAYIRVKNEDMTIFMVKKYLVTKLGLANENEVDILCMGQRLLNVQSLKVVRDAIWIPALVDSLNSSSKSLVGMPTPNLMPLLYQKI
ncbi:protein LAX PANICLE 2-like [Prosopis cineraria]|uniref:protein LAX PANICLE 2-like n=1 Tax=Prosopis cineraria TaxID=364024 RepID=UPI0024109AF6|nr:protein LAX PANICLE 2-like [Prosopis cineraria]